MTEANRLCPTCGGILVFSHEDDVYTKFYKCQQCATLHSQRTTPDEIATWIRQAKAFRHENEDKPKPPQLTCGNCVAFHSPFCSFAYMDEPDLKAFANYRACTRYFSKLKESPPKVREQSFARKVLNL